MTSPSVSVVLPNYNHGRYVGQALEALLTQSVRPLEVIVVDDGSTDDSREVLERFRRADATVKPVFNERNRGAALTTNRGIELAKGDLLYFASADDFVLPGFLENAVRTAERFPEAALIWSDPIWVDEATGRKVTPYLPLGSAPRGVSGSELVHILRERPFSVPGSTTLAKRTAVLEAGLYQLELRAACDWFMFLVIAFRHGVAYGPGALSVKRMEASSLSSSPANRKWEMRKPLLKSLLGYLNSPQYADVRDAFIESGVLSLLEGSILRLALTDPAARSTLTPFLVWRSLDAMLRGWLRPVVPERLLWARREARSKLGAKAIR